MAIYFGGKEIAEIHYGGKAITTVYKGAKVVWEAIRSCFGKGYWINGYPWDNKDAWKNNS